MYEQEGKSMKEVFKLIRSTNDGNPDNALNRLIPAGTPVSEMGWGSSFRSFASRYSFGRKVLGIRESKFLVVGLDYSGIIIIIFFFFFFFVFCVFLHVFIYSVSLSYRKDNNIV